jgi:predicted permease
LIEFLALAALCVAQNAAFTWSSRSRTSGDPTYHFQAALFSNGLYFCTSLVIFKLVAEAVNSGIWWQAITAGVIYTLATSIGSAWMMKFLLAKEKGKRRVGAY